jgi:hypothetical protein
MEFHEVFMSSGPRRPAHHTIDAAVTHGIERHGSALALQRINRFFGDRPRGCAAGSG